MKKLYILFSEHIFIDNFNYLNALRIIRLFIYGLLMMFFWKCENGLLM